MKRFGILFLVAAFVVVGIGFAPQEKAEKQESAAPAAKTTGVYTCPMHPDVQSSKPGECPKCNMSLVKKSTKSERAAAKKGSSGCCCNCCCKAMGSKGSSMKMECQADSSHAEHMKGSMKGCCAK